jgi:chromosome segregation ATPase
LVRYAQDMEKLNEEKRLLELENAEIEDTLKSVELLLKTRNQELSEQQNKYDKLITEKKTKQDQLDEIVLKLTNLLETKKLYNQETSMIKSILPQLEKEEENKKIHSKTYWINNKIQ